MKASTAYAFAWISTGIAVSVALYVTKNANVLWTMLIPTCISFSQSDK
jgi:hypothetical protein